MQEDEAQAEATDWENLSGRENAAIFLLFIGCALCADEMAPGWGWLGLGWSRETYYALMAVIGAASGALWAKRPLLGVIPGVLVGVGALWVNVYQLTDTNSIHTAVLALGAMAGALPGVLLYQLLVRVFAPHSEG